MSNIANIIIGAVEKVFIMTIAPVDVKRMLGLRIKEFRKFRKMTPGAAGGAHWNRTKQCFKKSKLAKNYPTPENLAKIALALNIEIHELFMFDNYQNQ